MNPLWLAFHFPCLPLEALTPLTSPSAVVEQGRILACDATARQAGIDTGKGVAASRMLAPGIKLMVRNPVLEQAALQTLACWAGGYTPRVSLATDTLLLDIGSCLSLFGGLESLVRSAKAGVQAQRFTVGIAVAPTPLAAQWLAQSGTESLCADRTALRQQLDALPISLLPKKAAASLMRFGAATLADVRKLPSAALAKRVGTETLQLLARAYGEMADPRLDFVFPSAFSQSLQLPASVEHAPALMFASRRLTSALAGWLAARQAGIRTAVLQLQHREKQTEVVLQYADLTADNRRFERVLRERLERLHLPAPVESLRLEAAQVAFLPGRHQALFADSKAPQEGLSALLERLSARLGAEQVYRIARHDDHRPECASRPLDLSAPVVAKAASQIPRPLWLLDKPEALLEVDGRPYRRGHLTLLAGPERIESGWWDSGEAMGDIRRDYFIVQSSTGSWLWVYRECRVPGGWFLQGFFS